MAGLAWKWPRTRLPMGASALGVFVLCWLYVFPVYRLPDEKEIVQGVLLQQGKAWRRNQTAVALFRKLLEECCDPGQLFAMTKMNSPMGKNLWFDGEFLYSVTIDNATYSLFPQATPFQLPLKKCSVVGNGGILKKSGCGKQIDQADFVMRCNLPPLSSEYSKDVGSKTQLVTANPSIIQKRFQNLLWSRKAFVDSVKVYNHSYIYMPAFSMKTGTGPSLRVYYTLEDFGAKQAVLFANPNFLRDIGKFWKSKEVILLLQLLEVCGGSGVWRANNHCGLHLTRRKNIHDLSVKQTKIPFLLKFICLYAIPWDTEGKIACLSVLFSLEKLVTLPVFNAVQ
uniref:ST8 alpha-N-acetyl-neuraminide alpha-2,8-sialyltransferase 1 n=1 Tax=Ficedula albicollis TaxID=59894 RepID=A0A803VMG0_FICAL